MSLFSPDYDYFPDIVTVGTEYDFHSLAHARGNSREQKGSDPVAREALRQIHSWYTERFAELVTKLDAIPEGDGTLLDHCVMLYGSELALGNHDCEDIPLLLAGGGRLWRSGRFIEAPAKTPICTSNWRIGSASRRANLATAMSIPTPETTAACQRSDNLRRICHVSGHRHESARREQQRDAVHFTQRRGLEASLPGRGRDARDAEAWREFVRRYGPCVFEWCRRWRVQDADAHDVTQAVLLKMLRRLPTFEYDPSLSFLALLRTVARYTWIDLRDERQRAGVPVEQIEPSIALPNDVAGYELLGVLGRGGMGVVYRARQTALNRVVALKMILAAAHAGERLRRRFANEAELVARLSSPGIVGVYDYGVSAGGLPYLAIEYVPGGSLSRLLAGRTHPPCEAARFLAELADALHAAHRAGIIHRDIKPGNVLLAPRAATADGTGSTIQDEVTNLDPESLEAWSPKLTDFGLAKLIEEADGERPRAAALTATDAVLGTPLYMSPEQTTGPSAALGLASNVYSLGAILFETLTGRPPFSATTAVETMRQVMTTPAPDANRVRRDVPADLAAICRRALAKSVGERYANAAELAADLRRFLRGEPALARGFRPRTPRRARPLWIGAALATLLFGATGWLLVGSWSRAQLDQRTTTLDAVASRSPLRPAPRDVIVENHSFEDRPLEPGTATDDPVAAPGWLFESPDQTQMGILRPQESLYLPGSRGAVAAGADGRNVVWLFREHQDTLTPVLRQVLTESLAADTDYELTVAVGHRLPRNPYGTRYGGFRIDLIAGADSIGTLTDPFIPRPGQFEDTTLTIPASSIPIRLIGRRLTIELRLSQPEPRAATDFDHLRLRAIDHNGSR